MTRNGANGFKYPRAERKELNDVGLPGQGVRMKAVAVVPWPDHGGAHLLDD